MRSWIKAPPPPNLLPSLEPRGSHRAYQRNQRALVSNIPELPSNTKSAPHQPLGIFSGFGRPSVRHVCH
jgi:hypothetical protein